MIRPHFQLRGINPRPKILQKPNSACIKSDYRAHRHQSLTMLFITILTSLTHFSKAQSVDTYFKFHNPGVKVYSKNGHIVDFMNDKYQYKEVQHTNLFVISKDNKFGLAHINKGIIEDCVFEAYNINYNKRMVNFYSNKTKYTYFILTDKGIYHNYDSIYPSVYSYLAVNNATAKAYINTYENQIIDSISNIKTEQIRYHIGNSIAYQIYLNKRIISKIIGFRNKKTIRDSVLNFLDAGFALWTTGDSSFMIVKKPSIGFIDKYLNFQIMPDYKGLYTQLNDSMFLYKNTKHRLCLYNIQTHQFRLLDAKYKDLVYSTDDNIHYALLRNKKDIDVFDLEKNTVTYTLKSENQYSVSYGKYLIYNDKNLAHILYRNGNQWQTLFIVDIMEVDYRNNVIIFQKNREFYFIDLETNKCHLMDAKF